MMPDWRAPSFKNPSMQDTLSDRSLEVLKCAISKSCLLRLFPPAFRDGLDRSVQKRVASGAIWSILGAGLASGLTMISNIASARLLGSTRYGQLAIVLSTTNLCTTLFTSGVGMTATRYVAEYRDSAPGRAGMIVGLSTATSVIVGAVMAVLLCAIAPWMSRDVLHGPGLARALCLGAITFFFAAVNGSQTGVLSGFEAFRWVAGGNLVRGLSIFLFVTIGAAFWGLTGALAGYIAVGAITAVFYQMIVRRECAIRAVPICYRFRREDFSILWRFTFPVLLTTFSFTPAAWWSNVLLARKSGYAEAGVFNAVYTWQLLIMFLSTAISSVGLPMLSNVRAEGDPAKYKKFLTIDFLLVPAPALVAAVPVAICASWIIRLYGPAFQHGGPALVLISVAAVLSALNIPVGHALWSLDASVPAMLLAAVNGITLVTAAYLLGTKGAAGLAGAYVIMGVVQSCASAFFIVWLLRTKLASAITKSAEAVAA